MNDCYHTFFRRLAAGIIDAVVLIPIAMVQSAIEPATELFAVLWAVIFSSLFVLYYALMHARYGQTLGKMVARVLVLDVSEEKSVTVGQAFRREIGVIALNVCALLVAVTHYVLDFEATVTTTVVGVVDSAAVIWFVLEVFSMFTNPKRRALHDFIAGTVVLKTA